MSFKLTILGSNSAIPTVKKNPTAQLLNADERFFLIDCGEGTQIQLLKNKIKAHKINHIFISHLHGDHYLGLMGLLSTMHLMGRKTPLNLYLQQNATSSLRKGLLEYDKRKGWRGPLANIKNLNEWYKKSKKFELEESINWDLAIVKKVNKFSVNM